MEQNPQLVKKFPIFYGTPMFVTVFTKACQWCLVPVVPILAHTFQSYLLTLYSSITFPTAPKSSKWSLPFKLSNQNIIRISHQSHACYMSRRSHPPW